MSAGTADCDYDRLQQLLEGRLSPVDEAHLTRHVEACTACRRLLESFAAQDEWWTGARTALSGVSPSDLPRTGESLGDRASWNAGTLSLPLDFLSKSDNPAMLGRLDEFEILELIGSGGMGIVLKGYDHELNRYVAIKVLHPYCATSAAARRRFAREAQAAAAIVHQHVVAIHAVGANHYPPYLVMSYVPGESLQQRLNREGPLEVIDVLRIGQQVAEGLAAAHAQGLVHRDIKPGNILLERNVERVLLTDFGLARAADDASLTQSGVIAGTPQFMSPEQTRGDEVDHRTDLFSLGTVMYTLLAGHSPFRAETAMGVLRRVCDDQPRALRDINPAVPEWLERFVGTLQAKQPSQRFESAAKVAQLLKQCLSALEQPGSIPLPRELQLLRRQPRLKQQRNAWWRKVVILSAGIAIGAVMLATILPWISKPGDVPPNGSDIPSTSPPPWEDAFRNDAQEIDFDLRRLEQQTENEF